MQGWLKNELDRIKADKEIVDVELENQKLEFARTLINGMGQNIKENVNVPPKKFKKPFKVRFGNWKERMKNKMKIVFGLTADNDGYIY